MTQLLSDQFVKEQIILDDSEVASVVYHNLFDYPLKLSDLLRWRAGKRVHLSVKEDMVNESQGFFYIGNRALIYKKLMGERVCKGKMSLARKAAKAIKLIPSVRMVGITGALAMKNASTESDIDLIIVTNKNTLWTTRTLVLLLLKILNIPVRRYGEKLEKDKLCLNMWLDESTLCWRGARNIFTAHELAQIIPLYDSGGIYNRMKMENGWIKGFWPYAFGKERVKNLKHKTNGFLNNIFRLLNFPLMKLQCLYMRKKVTREVIDLNRALFHPIDWGKIVNLRLKPYT